MANTLKIGTLAWQRKAKNIKAYDVRGLTVVADVLVLCSASSEPQIKAIFNDVRDTMKKAGVPPVHTEGSSKSGWALIDYGDIVFHLFREEAREFYDLDGLWADAPLIDLGLDKE